VANSGQLIYIGDSFVQRLSDMTARMILLVLFWLLPAGAFAQTAWVTDQFEITLRTGPSTSNAIQMMLASGTELSVVERDADSGWTRVRTPGGTEGWVLSRYLMRERSAREQLEALQAELSNANSRGSTLNTQLEDIQGQYSEASSRIETLEAEKSALEQELADIKRTAANVISINSENTRLREDLAAAEIRIGSLEQENRELEGQAARFWFVTGAAVLVLGMILGIWLPRIRWQRRSRYDRF
jgi:SH3 domain protein